MLKPEHTSGLCWGENASSDTPPKTAGFLRITSLTSLLAPGDSNFHNPS